MMIPARTNCFDGWTKEYDGYLAAETKSIREPCIASSSNVSWNATADIAVEGDTHTIYFTGKSCTHTHTAGDHYSRWAVDLEKDFHTKNVKIHERDDAGADGNTSISTLCQLAIHIYYPYCFYFIL
ncbi:uncharacterized protein LOC128218932 [Mya arenaria]|uniref:uncharacterized protein LOC128218932 n=1 Tax=Mya arenaria TaxID=6604 RepID=UPI0022E67E59|nr:uncharacterized protein LOC128218932 [Mya arenaria]